MHDFSIQELEEIEAMAGLGLRYEDIASIKGVCDDTLKKYAKDYLMRGKARAKAQVMETAYKMAVSGKTPSMTMFWLKTQAGWREGMIDSDAAENNQLTPLVEQINQSNKPSQVILLYMAEILDQVKQGMLEPKAASSIASMSNLLLKAAEQSELEKRLSSLESVIKYETTDEDERLSFSPQKLNLSTGGDELAIPTSKLNLSDGGGN